VSVKETVGRLALDPRSASTDLDLRDHHGDGRGGNLAAGR
jgi:hypothetical protein